MFVGLSAFDRHRISGGCADPATVFNKKGNAVFEKRGEAWHLVPNLRTPNPWSDR